MEKLLAKNMIVLDDNQLKNCSAGNDNICAALAGATLTSAAFLWTPGVMVFGAGYLIFCVEGHG